MATTAVAICNRALRHCRGPRITSLDDASEAARVCKEAYNEHRKELLEGHPWNFAMKRQEIAVEASEVPAYQFDNVYLLPGACISLREIEGFYKASQYQVENRRIFCNDAGPLFIKYTDDANADKFTPLFAKALAASIAIDILPTIQNSNVKRQTLIDMFRVALSQAKRSDAMENAPDEPVEDEWDLARQG